MNVDLRATKLTCELHKSNQNYN